MISNWTFGRALTVSYGLVGAILILVAAVGYRSTLNFIEDARLVSHTQDVRRELQKLQAVLVDVETTARGYALTGNASFLEEHEAAKSTLLASLEKLRTLTIDNLEQQRRLDDMMVPIKERFAISQRNIDARRQGGLAAAAETISIGQDRVAMERIRQLIADGERQERGLLEERSEAAQSGAFWTKNILLWGCVAGLLLVSVVGWTTIRSLADRIGSAVGRVRSSSAELQAAANQQVAGAKDQSAAMNEISTTIRELLATSKQIAESAQRVSQVAENTTAAARDGDDAVMRAHNSISGIRQQVDQIVDHMLDLGRKSQEIGSVLDIVTELAEQSNILAINATIEATGAGEAGKRFSVVADEIRKLSDRVAGSAKEIRGLIDDMRAAVNTTVMATEAGSKAVDGGSRQFEQVASSFREITTMIESTTAASQEIELSTKQQSTAVEQVTVAVADVAQAAIESEASSNQILQTASELASLSGDLTRIISSEKDR